MSSPFWTKLRKPKNGVSSPPDRLPPYDAEDVLEHAASLSSSLSSTINSGGGLYSSTPPTYNADENSSASTSPNTPKKDWEVNYKSYLSHVAEDKSADLSSDASSEHLVGFMKVPNLYKQPPSSMLIAQSLPHTISHPLPIRPQRIPSDGGGSSTRSRRNTGDSDGSDVSRDKSRGIRFKHSPSQHRSSLGDKASPTDESVHGGNFFQNMFRKKKESSSNSQPTLEEKMRKRTQSFSALDSAMRKGAEVVIVAEKPKEVRSMPARFLQPGSVIGGPKIRSRRAGKKQDNRQRKLKFTEFHNSQKYARDSTAAYLGEEKSVQRGSQFAQISKYILCVSLYLCACDTVF